MNFKSSVATLFQLDGLEVLGVVQEDVLGRDGGRAPVALGLGAFPFRVTQAAARPAIRLAAAILVLVLVLLGDGALPQPGGRGGRFRVRRRDGDVWVGRRRGVRAGRRAWAGDVREGERQTFAFRRAAIFKHVVREC